MHFFKRATVYLGMGRTRQALKDLNKVLSLKPEFEQARTRRADLLLKKGDYAGAREDLAALVRHTLSCACFVFDLECLLVDRPRIPHCFLSSKSTCTSQPSASRATRRQCRRSWPASRMPSSWLPMPSSTWLPATSTTPSTPSRPSLRWAGECLSGGRGLDVQVVADPLHPPPQISPNDVKLRKKRAECYEQVGMLGEAIGDMMWVPGNSSPPAKTITHHAHTLQPPSLLPGV